MFQDFADHTEKDAGVKRLALLRARLDDEGLGGFIVPHADAFQSEYLPASSERLAWLSGFTGSAGLAIILRERAVLFVDGRYTLQAQEQSGTNGFEIVHTAETSPEAWLASHLGRGVYLGYDPWLLTVRDVRRFAAAVEGAGSSLVAHTPNPIDALWKRRPPAPASQIEAHPHAGETSEAKRERLRAELHRAGADACILTDPASTAWLLNIRGHDVPHTPLVLSFSILDADAQAHLFVRKSRVSASVRKHLGGEVEICAPTTFDAALAQLGAAGAHVLVDEARTPAHIITQLKKAGAHVETGADPCLLPRARKNKTEIAGARAAHIRDGAALTSFLCWIEAEAASGRVDEIKAAKRLEAYRQKARLIPAGAPGALKDVSFDTISATGPHGAIVHYRVSKKTNRRLAPGDLYLVDSGGQYVDGTTDVTRTVAIGKPGREERERFTLVLKGHIDLARARFPAGTTGAQLDTFARAPLWSAGLDFAHGTGHGVGSYLSVHEGPHTISPKASVPLEPGMIVSNEPGYYKEGAYGIRIESLLVVRAAKKTKGHEAEEEHAMLSFETLTLAPIDRALIQADMLSVEERAWLNAYHARVRKLISPLLDDKTQNWLRTQTRKI